MIRDEDLHSSRDYNAGQREAARRVLVELAQILKEYEDEIRIVGGWVPDLLFPEQGHVGSVDVDVLLNHESLRDSGYQTIERILVRNGYNKHAEKYFSFVKPVVIEGMQYDVDVDFLAGMYGGTGEGKRSQHVQGIKALKATGGNFCFTFPPLKKKMSSRRPDGACDQAVVNLVSIVPFFVMKTAAMGRGKPKDAYDLYFVVRHYQGGPQAVSREFMPFVSLSLVEKTLEKLQDKFASPEHAGPVDVADFLEASGEERDFICRDAYERMNVFLSVFPHLTS